MMGPETEIVAAGIGEAMTAMLVSGVVYVALFSWLAVVGWARQRRLEREACYRHETEKKLVESGQATTDQIFMFRVEEERNRWLRRREGLRLGGFITAALGVGLVVGLRFVDTNELAVSMIGWIPFSIGAVMLLYTFVLYPRFTASSGTVPPGRPDDREAER